MIFASFLGKTGTIHKHAIFFSIISKDVVQNTIETYSRRYFLECSSKSSFLASQKGVQAKNQH